MEKGGVSEDDACGHHTYGPPIPKSVLNSHRTQKIIAF